jgi:hypothetical protein
MLPRFILAEVLDAMHADADQKRSALVEILRLAPGSRPARQALEALNRPAAALDARLFNGVAVASSFQMQVG